MAKKRLGRSLASAAAQARRSIHENDVEALKQLLAECPALLSWQGHDAGARDGVLGFATGSYGDSFDPSREGHFTRAACAELLIDAGAVVMPTVVEGILASRARGLLDLFRRKGLLPRTLKFFAALDDVDAVRVALGGETDVAAIAEAFTIACSFEHERAALLLLDRTIALDPELRANVDGGLGRAVFTKSFIDTRPRHAVDFGLWKAFVMEQVNRAVYSWSGGETSFKNRRGRGDLPAFVRLLDQNSWLRGEPFVGFQATLIERATLVGEGAFISALLELNPAIVRREPPLESQAIEFALTYANSHLMPLLTRVWPLPDDLPHAAGTGDLSRVKQWFDDSGGPALGALESHYPSAPYMPRDRVEEYARQWGPLNEQRVLDVALAWSVINGHLDVAEFLLQHGADINTTWSSHEPASILHELVWHRNYEAMQFLIDRGIDMTIKDHRWNATAQGWARHAAEDPALAEWLDEAEKTRTMRTP